MKPPSLATRMPELPEVEFFRQLLLPLVGSGRLNIEAVGDNHRIQLTDGLSPTSTQGWSCANVLRKGKLLCLVLTSTSSAAKYLFLHMGMTGRIRVQGRAENWGFKQVNGAIVETDLNTAEAPEDEVFPPKYTYLLFTTRKCTAYFCDPRKFGSCYLADDLSDLDALAPDALTCTDAAVIAEHIVPALTNQRLGIKAILLDQRRAVSGVGNWMADEVLYHCQMHPDQTRLTESEAADVWTMLQSIATTAAHALSCESHYPESWLFHYRWTRKKATRDALGRSVTFVTSGGRTTAILASLQKLHSRYASSSSLLTVNGKKPVVRTNEPMKANASKASPLKVEKTRKRAATTVTAKRSVTLEVMGRRQSPRLRVTPK